MKFVLVNTMLICLSASLCGFAQDEQARLSFDLKVWIQQTLEDKDGSSQEFSSDLPAEQICEQLLEYTRDPAVDPRHKLCALKLIAEYYPVTGIDTWQQLIQDRMADSEIRIAAIQIFSLYRLESSIELFVPLLRETDPEILSAAIDAIGIWHAPAYLVGSASIQPQASQLRSDPKVILDRVINLGTRLENPEFDDADARKVRGFLFSGNREVGKEPSRNRFSDANQIRERIVDLMVSHESVEVRNAASRALATWPLEDRTRFRVAEWGVWLSNDSNLQLVESVIEEIPDFVTETPEKVAALDSRVNKIMIVTKPVIHVTVDRPVGFDLSAAIRRGQVWFSYPSPNDYWLILGGFFRDDLTLDDSHFAEFRALVESGECELESHYGYPWIEFGPRMFGDISGGMGEVNRLQGIGVFWQSLIATPEKLNFASEPEVSEDKKWWSDLREVKSSWVAKDEQAEKFIYYDGPTFMDSPYEIKKEGEAMQVTRIRDHKRTVVDPDQGIWIKVSESGAISAKPFQLKDSTSSQRVRKPTTEAQKEEQKRYVGDHEYQSVSLSFENTLVGQNAIKEFQQQLMGNNGLTKSESSGLIRAWEKQFFETPGERLIIRFSREEYDYFCPIHIRPTPTEFARVGLILHEFESEE